MRIIIKFKLILVLFSLISIITIYGQQTKEENEKVSHKFVYLGNQKYLKGDFQGAKLDYKKALENSPQNTTASFNLGNTYFQNKEWEEARSSFNSIVNNSKSSSIQRAKAFHNIGNSFMEEQKWSEAIEAFKSSLRLQPKNFDTKYNLAYAQQKLKEQQDKDQNKDKENKEENKDEQNENKDQKDKNNSDQNNKDKNNDNKDNKDKQQPNPAQMNQQQAEAKINALKQNEKKIQEQKNNQKVNVGSYQKDW